MEYTVEIALHTEAPLTEEALMQVAGIGGAASGRVGENRLDTTLTVDARSASACAATAERMISGIISGTVIGITILTTEEADRRADMREELVGVGEIAQMLKISKQRVTTLSKRQDFPAPLQRLASGPVWRKSDLSTFADGWQRKGGRPSAKGKMMAAEAEHAFSAAGEVRLPQPRRRAA